MKGRKLDVARLIRRQIKSKKHRRVLRTHRAFKIDPKTPPEIAGLLDQLEQVEQEQEQGEKPPGDDGR